MNVDKNSAMDETSYVPKNEHLSRDFNGKVINGQVVNRDALHETSSVDIPTCDFDKKPKKGVINKVNLVLRRMFNSKL